MFVSMLCDSMAVAVASPKPDRSCDLARSAHFGIVEDRATERVISVPRAHVLRAPTEACIRKVYEQVFGAGKLEFPGMLIALVGAENRPLCAAALRTAGEGFFSETYLDAPIERVLSAQLRRPVAREDVFEVATLASQNVKVSPVFLRQLAILRKRAGFDWSFFTATARLRKLLRHLRIPILELGPADPQRLSDSDRWGTYYTHSPQVCAVDGQWLDGSDAPREGILADA